MDQSVETTQSTDLSKLKLVELQRIASSRGIRGISRMRKSELLQALQGGSAAESPNKSSYHDATAVMDENSSQESLLSATGQGGQAGAVGQGVPVDSAEQPKRQRGQASRHEEALQMNRGSSYARGRGEGRNEIRSEARDGDSGGESGSRSYRERQNLRRSRRRVVETEAVSPEASSRYAAAEYAVAELLDQEGLRTRNRNGGFDEANGLSGAGSGTGAENGVAGGAGEGVRAGAGLGSGMSHGARRHHQNRYRQNATDEVEAQTQDILEAVAKDLEKLLPVTDDSEEAEERDRAQEHADRIERQDRRDRNQNRRERTQNRRDRNQNRRERTQNRDAGPEIREDDVLIPIAGILDVQSNHGFVRTSGYLPGNSDVYVALANIRRWGLRAGDAVAGQVRQAREGERRQQKYNALVRVDSVNGLTVEEALARREFSKLTPEYPNSQLRLETTPKAVTPRVIDLVAPVGKGQRGLIVAPPKAGKTMVIQQIAKAIEVNNPEVHLMVVLVDERPEEVTDMRAVVKGEVIASTFDRPASDHTMVAELAIERAKRLVEMGQDVVVLLDSLTRLSRAYNLAAPTSGRILSGGVDAAALYPPKKFFGAARNLREGGSLTIIASALVETGSKMDEVIFEEFKGTGNMELRLSRQLADRRIFPSIDVNASGTRREELLLRPEELAIMWRLRRVLGTLDAQQAIELMLSKLKETQSNAEFLLAMQKTVPAEG